MIKIKYSLLIVALLFSGYVFINGQDSHVENIAIMKDLDQVADYTSTSPSSLIEVSGLFKEDVFCWKETYGRGVGTIPTICPNGMENQAGLCYTLCSPEYYGVGPVCWKSCPADFRDDGAFCFKPEAYGRGAGYAIWDLDVCEKNHGKGNCEKYGLIWYPKCKEGFYPAGCCLCSPVCPEGWSDIGVSCAKPSYGRGVGVVPTICPNGMENQAGLCYQLCKDGFQGVGPVCWEVVCPNVNGKVWVDCGAGCAQSNETCATSIIDMVISPLVAVLSIAGMVVTGGGSGAITATASTGKILKYTAKAVKGVSKISQAAIKNDLMAKAKEQLNGQPMPEHQQKGIEEYAAMAYDAARAYDFDWRDFVGVDPTGLGGVAAAYANPLCKDMKSSLPNSKNVALNKPAKQSSSYSAGPGKDFQAGKAVDGVKEGFGLLSHTLQESGAWWEVDLGRSYNISSITVYNATDHPQRMDNFTILVSETPFTGNSGGVAFIANQKAPNPTQSFTGNAAGRYVRLFLNGTNYLTIHEIEIFAGN